MVFVMKVQLAHGSAVRFVSNFSNISELYECIAHSFQLNPDDILFCTVNTHKPDVNALLFGTITEDDLVFAHLAGDALEFEAEKTGEFLGVTITDNGAGNIVVKQIHQLTVAAKTQLKTGDVLVKANGQSLKGMRHCEASAMLRAIPVGAKVRIEVIRPFMEGFSFVSARTQERYRSVLFSADPPLPPPRKPTHTTIRFAINDGEVIRCSSRDDRFCRPSTVIRLNALLDSYFGFHDDDLAVHLWRISKKSENFAIFCDLVASDAEMRMFQLPENVLQSMWTVLKAV